MRSSCKALSQLVISEEGPSPSQGGAIPELVVLGSIRKQVEQVMRSKPVSSTPPWSLHQLQVAALFEFLPSKLLMMNCNRNSE